MLYARQLDQLGQVIDPRNVAMMNTMMQETLLSGTARKAEIPGWTAAGKTGTSQDFRDAWFIGYTSQLVTGVWLGNDDNSPTRKATGGGLPVEVWTRFMRAAHQGVAVAAQLPEIRGRAALFLANIAQAGRSAGNLQSIPLPANSGNAGRPQAMTHGPRCGRKCRRWPRWLADGPPVRPLRTEALSRRAGTRFADKDVLQHENLRRFPVMLPEFSPKCRSDAGRCRGYRAIPWRAPLNCRLAPPRARTAPNGSSRPDARPRGPRGSPAHRAAPG